ncbi:MAG: hypothetical protein N2167_11045 [Flavobacteriales bacterium]|nr:hypothetical protein [Flavobacteriales bacterium]
MKNWKIYAVLAFMVFIIPTYAQTNPEDERPPRFSFGARSTMSLFSHGEPETIGVGAGGQFRVQITDRINTEWFADVISTRLHHGLASRMDYHIGWSVMFYILHPKNFSRKFTPYVVAGHCFDYTRLSIHQRDETPKARWSSAVQMGGGVHYNITRRFDITLTCQYMMHLGNDLHIHFHEDGSAEIEEHAGTTGEGHLLVNLSVNYKIGKPWKRKK